MGFEAFAHLFNGLRYFSREHPFGGHTICKIVDQAQQDEPDGFFLTVVHNKWIFGLNHFAAHFNVVVDILVQNLDIIPSEEATRPRAKLFMTDLRFRREDLIDIVMDGFRRFGGFVGQLVLNGLTDAFIDVVEHRRDKLLLVM